MSSQFTWHKFVLVPLSPIHVGGAEESQWLPHAYRLSRDRRFVERFSPYRLIGRLPPDERQRLLRESDRNLQNFARMLRGRAEDADIIERVVIAEDSAKAVDPDGAGTNRSNRIDSFYRAGGRPVLPGSSLKGALRTAWVARMVQCKQPPLPPGRSHWSSQSLEASVLELAEARDHRQDSDPFRDVVVRDATLPKGATRIDKVWSWKRGQSGYQFSSVGEMHRERMLSLAEGGEPPLVAVSIGLRAGWVRALRQSRDPGGERWPKKPPDDAGALLAALEAHHAPLWHGELQKFFGAGQGCRLAKALDAVSAFDRKGDRPEAALLRLGWAGHAEAKSIDGYRRIERPQAEGVGRFASEGSARHVVKLGEDTPVSFGWALLVRKEAWDSKKPQTFLREELSGGRSVSSGGQSTRAGKPSGSGVPPAAFLYRKGQKVKLVTGEIGTLTEDVPLSSKPTVEVMAEIDGSREPIKVEEIEGPA